MDLSSSNYNERVLEQDYRCTVPRRLHGAQLAIVKVLIKHKSLSHDQILHLTSDHEDLSHLILDRGEIGRQERLRGDFFLHEALFLKVKQINILGHRLQEVQRIKPFMLILMNLWLGLWSQIRESNHWCTRPYLAKALDEAKLFVLSKLI